jgi:hypothetical protein
MGTIMNFKEMLLDILLEGKIEDTLDRYPTIPHDVKQNYLKQIPAQNAQHLDWVLSQHTKGNITSSHNISGMLDTFNKVKDKLQKKQVAQYKSVDELHSAVVPHQDNIKKSDKEKSKEGTETLYTSPTMTIRQHHNYESTISGAVLPKNNKSGLDKATWCISVGNGGGAGHYSKYTENGFHPVYTIEHKHEDGTSSRHMLVANHIKTQLDTELRDEADHRPGFSDHVSSRPDLLDHYASEHPELMKTPIAHLFNEDGRVKYATDARPAYAKLEETLKNIPKTGMSDEEYMSNFKAGQEKRQGGIHNVLANSVLSPSQLNHFVENGNEGSKHEVASRMDLTAEHIQKLSNTSNMLVHHILLDKPNLSDDAFNNIVNKSHPENIEKVIKHPKFNETHLDTLLDKKMSKVDLSSLVERFHTKLEAPHIQKIIDKGDEYTHHTLLNKIPTKIDAKHISTMIDNDNANVNNKIVSTLHYKLEPHHIDTIIGKGDSEVNSTLIDTAYHKLEPHHIETLKASGDARVNYTLENRVHENLEPHEISTLIAKGDSEVHDKLINKFPNKLEPHHISDLINRGNIDTQTKIINQIPDKLDSTHISTLIDNGGYRSPIKQDNRVHLHNHILEKLSDKFEQHHINEFIDKGFDYEPFVNKMHEKLEPHHISELINNISLQSQHNRIIIDPMRNKLNSTHISALIAKHPNNPDIINKLHDKLEPKHFSELIDKGNMDTRVNTIKMFHDILKPSHISELIEKGGPNIHGDVISRLGNRLKPSHISSLIHNGDGGTHYSLMTNMYDKLEPHHISELIDRGSDGIRHNIVSDLSEKLNSSHISSLIDKGNSDVHNKIINNLSDKLEPKHISALIDKGDSDVLPKIIDKLHSKLDSSNISALIDKGDVYSHSKLIGRFGDKLEPKHIKGLMDNASTRVVNDVYDNLPEESKKAAVSHAQKMKDSGNDKWAEFYNIHKDMPLSDVDKVKKDIHASLNGPAFPVRHNLSDEEIKTHIHPIIDNEIDNNNGSRRSGQNLIRFSSMINKEQTKKLLNNIGDKDSINYTYDTELSNHVRDAIFDHAIKTGNHKLMNDTLVSGGNLHNIAPHHLEHIKVNHPENMPEIDANGTHAKELVATAIKDKNDNTISKFTNSYNPKYRSAILDHTLDTDNTAGVLRHIVSRDNTPHNDLDKILSHQNTKGYKGPDSDRILQTISSIPNLHSSHIDHIIKSGNEDAIKNVIGSDYTSGQKLTPKHKDDIISLKNKELSKHLGRHQDMNPVQSFNNSKVLSEWYVTNNVFEQILKESLIGK